MEDGFILKGIRIKFMYRKYCLRLQQARLVISMRHLIIVLFVLTSNQVFSNAVSELPSDEPYLALSLLDTVTLAVKNHPSIKAKVREVVATESDLSAAKLNTFPELSFSSQAVYNNENTRVLTLSQPIWAGGQLKATIEQAKALVDAAKGEMKSQESIIINETVAAFFNFVAADKKLSLYQANIEEHERLVGVITRRSSAQLSPEIDVMLAKARLAQAQSQEAQIRTNRHIARAELEQLLGQPVSSVESSGNEDRFFDILTKPLDELEAKAINYSPELDVLTAAVRRAEADIRLASAEGKPKVALGYEKRFGEVLFGQEREQIYLGLNYQPGAGFSSGKRLSSAKSRKHSVAMDKAAAERQVRRDLQVLFMQHRSAQDQIMTSVDLVQAAGEVVSSYLRQYAVGKKSWLDALNAQRESVQARDALINFELSFARSGIQILVLLGMINGDGFTPYSLRITNNE